MGRSLEVTILLGCAGWYVEWFRYAGDGGPDDDGAYQTQYWYGTREECEARAELPPDPRSWVTRMHEGAPPYDAATATGMYDHY